MDVADGAPDIEGLGEDPFGSLGLKIVPVTMQVKAINENVENSIEGKLAAVGSLEISQYASLVVANCLE